VQAKEKSPDVVKALEFYEKFTKHIEVNFKKKLVRVYFSVHPYTFYLTENTEKILKDEG